MIAPGQPRKRDYSGRDSSQNGIARGRTIQFTSGSEATVTPSPPSPRIGFLRTCSVFERFLSLWERVSDLLRRRTPKKHNVRLALEGMEERVVPDGRPLPLPV